MKKTREFLVAVALLVTGGVATFVTQEQSAQAAGRKTTVSVVLEPQNRQAMIDAVYDTVDPSSQAYHKYLSTSQVGDTYGQPTAKLNQFKAYFKRYKLATAVYPGNLMLKVSGQYSNVLKAFKAKLVTSKHKVNVTLPKTLAGQVDSVVGLTMGAKKAKVIKNTKATTRPNLKLNGADFSKQYGAQKFVDNYQLNALYDKGLEGQGQRIGLVMLSDYNKGDVATYLQKNGLAADTTRLHKYYAVPKSQVTQAFKLPAAMPAQMEASLDVQQAASLAPKAEIDTFLGTMSGTTNTPVMTDASFLNTFAEAISRNIDKQISTSYTVGNEVLGFGELPLSETKEEYSQAFDTLFQQAALQGITIFNASGDHGPYDSPNKKPNLSIPTSAYEVEVGGTQLPFSKKLNGKQVTVTKERAWGDVVGLSKEDISQGVFEGSGGGFSVLNPTPRYQLGFPGVNTFNAIQHLTFSKGKYVLNRDPKVISGTGSGRNVPDVSGNAAGATGYATYFTARVGKKTNPIWMVGGGTSYVAPQMAAANAVMNSGLKSVTGFWNPQIYTFAQTADSPFNPLQDTTNNDNLYYTGQPGKLYNQATGLGTVNFEKLYNHFNRQ